MAAVNLMAEERALFHRQTGLLSTLSFIEANLDEPELSEKDLSLGIQKLKEIEDELSSLETKRSNFDERKRIASKAKAIIMDSFAVPNNMVAFSWPVESMLMDKNLALYNDLIKRDVTFPFISYGKKGAVMRGVVYSGHGDGFLRRFSIQYLPDKLKDDDGAMFADMTLLAQLSSLAQKYRSLMPKPEAISPIYLSPTAIRERIQSEGGALRLGWDENEAYHSLWFGSGRMTSPVYQFEKDGRNANYLFSPNKDTKFALLTRKVNEIMSKSLLEEMLDTHDFSKDDFFTDVGIVLEKDDKNAAKVLFEMARYGKLFPPKGSKAVEVSEGLGVLDGRTRKKSPKPRLWALSHLREHEVRPTCDEFGCTLADGSPWVVFKYDNLNNHGLWFLEPPSTEAASYAVRGDFAPAAILLDRAQIRSLPEGVWARIEHRTDRDYWRGKVNHVLGGNLSI